MTEGLVKGKGAINASIIKSDAVDQARSPDRTEGDLSQGKVGPYESICEPLKRRSR
jgi:hypothetical protein